MTTETAWLYRCTINANSLKGQTALHCLANKGVRYPLFVIVLDMHTRTPDSQIDLELAIDPPPPRGSFVHYDFLKLHYIRNKMTHVSPLYVGALTCNVNVNYTTQNYIFRLR